MVPRAWQVFISLTLVLPAAGCAGRSRYASHKSTHSESPAIYSITGPDGSTRVVARTSPKQSFPNSVWDSVKHGFQNVTAMFKSNPKVDPARDPVKLSSKPKPPTAAMNFKFAEMMADSGQMDKAEKNYTKALAIDPKCLKILVGYAHFLDRQGRMDEAVKIYKKAAKFHPKQARVHNDLGLGLARNRRLEESVRALSEAIKLEPQRQLFHNNLATVYVEMDQTDKALDHLSRVNDPSKAHYNLGSLLQKKGRHDQAAFHFAKALEFDPSLAAARQWLETLRRAGPMHTMVASRPGNRSVDSNSAADSEPVKIGFRSAGTLHPARHNKLRDHPMGQQPSSGLRERKSRAVLPLYYTPEPGFKLNTSANPSSPLVRSSFETSAGEQHNKATRLPPVDSSPQ